MYMEALNIRLVDEVLFKMALLEDSVSAGFPSPADDHLNQKLDLNEHLIKHPESTYFVKVYGDSMVNAGIRSGDILIVDRSLEPIDSRVVIACINGDLYVKRIQTIEGNVYLFPENEKYGPIRVTPEMDFEIWGVVIHVIHSL